MSFSTQNDHQRLQQARQYWDALAATFDDEPDHGLRQPEQRASWQALLARWLPPSSVQVLDAGCGTGSLSVLLAAQRHAVTAIDVAPQMIAQARSKAAAQQQQLQFAIMDAATPAFAAQSFDAIVCRHLLWALPKPATVLARWAALLKPGGRLLLIEGRWDSGGGLRAAEIVGWLPDLLTLIAVESMSEQPAYWGKAVSDERYALIADRLAV